MKNRIFSLTVALACVCGVACSGETTPERAVTFRLEFRLKPGPKTSKVLLRARLPAGYAGRQEVKSITYSLKPTRIVTAGGDRYGEWVVEDPEGDVKITVTVAMVLLRCDLQTQKTDAPPPPAAPAYLADERWIESEAPQIRELAAEAEGKTPLEVARHLHALVLEKLAYGGYNPKSVGALATLQRGQGDCTDYCDLFVALCRARKIPARVAEGFITRWRSTPKHNWAEIHLPGRGWVPVDPLHAQMDRARFDRLENKYIYLTNKRSDPLLKGYNFWYCRSWGAPLASYGGTFVLLEAQGQDGLPQRAKL